MSYKIEKNSAWDHLTENESQIMNETNILINKSRETIKKILLLDINTQQKLFLKLLSDDLYEFNCFHAVGGLLQLVSEKKDVRDAWKKADEILRNHIKEFNSNKGLYSKIKAYLIRHTNIDYETKFFLERVLRSCEKYGAHKNDDNINKIREIIEKIEDHIECKLNDDEIMEVSLEDAKNNIEKDALKQLQINKTSVSIPVSSYTYKILPKYFKGKEMRDKFEKKYYLRTEKILKKITNLVVLRNEYAKLMGYNNFVEFKINKNDYDMEYLKGIVSDIVAKLDNKLVSEFKILYEKNGNNPVTIMDLNHFTDKENDQYKFKLDRALGLVFNVLENIFSIKFVKNNKQKLWHNEVITYDVIDETDFTFGVMYFDLKYRQGKTRDIISIPLSFNARYPFDGNAIKPSTIAVVGAYSELTEMINYNEIIKLFKIVGNSLFQICSKSKYGILNHDIEFDDFFDQLMESIASDKNVITKFTENDAITEKIMNHHGSVVGISIISLCRDILFDFQIHSSEEIVKISYEEFNDKKSFFALKELYSQASKYYFSSADKKVNMNNISPEILTSVIRNNTSGILYGKLLSKICARNTYLIISDNNNGLEFRKEVMANNLSPFKESIKIFLNKQKDTKNYSNFLSDLMGYKPCNKVNNDKINTETDAGDETENNILTDNSNYYEENVKIRPTIKNDKKTLFIRK
jgi:oligopeptidase A